MSGLTNLTGRELDDQAEERARMVGLGAATPEEKADVFFAREDRLDDFAPARAEHPLDSYWRHTPHNARRAA